MSRKSTKDGLTPREHTEWILHRILIGEGDVKEFSSEVHEFLRKRGLLTNGAAYQKLTQLGHIPRVPERLLNGSEGTA